MRGAVFFGQAENRDLAAVLTRSLGKGLAALLGGLVGHNEDLVGWLEGKDVRHGRQGGLSHQGGHGRAPLFGC